MGTQCYAMVRGSAIRVTQLDRRNGRPDGAGNALAVSRSVASVTINEVTDGGGRELIRTPDGEPRLHFIKPQQTIRYTADVDFLRCDPGILSLVTGVPVVYNAAGDIVGFDRDTRIPAQSFALEVWSRLAGNPCTVVETPGGGGGGGFGMGGFGEGGFGVGGDPAPAPVREWGYTLMPWMKGGTLGGFVFQNGAVTFNLRGAQMQRGARWGGDGLAYGVPMPTEVSRNTMWRQFITTVQPPAQTDGIQPAPVIEGGDAFFTTADILDGESVDTSSDVVEGGTAA